MKKYQDFYFKKAKQENYPARSVYKLQEIEKAYHIFKKGIQVLDLGASPGSWTLYAAEQVGPSGKVLAIDLNSIDVRLPSCVIALQGDVFEPTLEIEELYQKMEFDLVLSDMAPKTTGVKITDQSRSLYLVEEAFACAYKYARSGSNFVAKIFDGPDVQNFVHNLRQSFETVRLFKPKSTRSESKEFFIIGINLKK